MKLTLEQKIIAGFGLALALLVVIAVISYRATTRLTHDAARTARSHQVLTRLAFLLSTITDAETGVRGYTITGDETFLEPYREALRDIEAEFKALRRLTADNPGQQQRLDTLEPLLAARLAQSKKVSELRRTRGLAAAQRETATGKGKKLHDAIRAVVAEMEHEENLLLQQHQASTREATRFALAVIAAGGLVAFLLVGAALIVTRREFAGRKLAEGQFRLVVEAARNGIVMISESGIITLVNAQTEKAFGYTRAELVGQPVEVLVPERFRAPHPVQRRGFFADPKARAMGVGRDLFGRRKDGSEFPLEIGLSPIATSEGRVVLAAVVDVTERKRAEAALREAPDELERRVRKRTAELATINESLRNEIGQRRRAEEALQQAHDELETKVFERTAELKAARERADSADRLKSAFLATMSHELRTPLNTIIDLTAVLLQQPAGPLHPEQMKQLELVRDSARHLLWLINDVLDISKIEARQLEVADEPFDLRASIDRVVGVIAPLAEQKGLALRAEIAPEVGQAVGDACRVERILLNLLNNAVKFTEEGEVCLTARLIDETEKRRNGETAISPSPVPDSPIHPVTDSAAPRWVEVKVKDTGIGIPAEAQEKVFGKFYQVDSSETPLDGGVGLGLYIAKQFTELLGGEIALESEVGEGTTFTVRLPA